MRKVEGDNFVGPHQSRHLLIVDDDSDIQILLKANLEKEGFHVECVGSLEELNRAIEKKPFDAILLDVFVGQDNSLEILADLVERVPQSQIVVMTGHNSVDLAVEAMRKGADGFLVKSSDPAKIASELKASIYSQYGIAALTDEPMPENFGILGKSSRLKSVIAQINQMKDVDSTVLIQGESGTGKELAARAFHRMSKRAEFPFRAINCAAIPEALLESELFGHKKSSFTDAKADRKGYFEVCTNGTLLLDEIGDMPLPLQVKLLRVLQEREVTPVGSTDSVKVNTRVIASTNLSLERLVEKGRFREDLFYRLSVLRVQLPALRERPEDIPVLVNAFIGRFNERFEKNVKTPSAEVMSKLQGYPWPGNVRELQNVIERGVVLSKSGSLDFNDLFLSAKIETGVDSAPMTRLDTPKVAPFQLSTEKAVGQKANGLKDYETAKSEFDLEYLTRLLRETSGNISEASRVAGQYRTKIYRLLKKYSINPEDYKGTSHYSGQHFH